MTFNSLAYTTISLFTLVGILSIGTLTALDESGRKPSISSSTDREADEAFDKVMAVLTHKRCVNCHPSGDTPRQGEDSHLHNFDIVRGPKDKGLAGYTCNTCHQNENNDYSGVPGAPHWAVAPTSMAWEGKTRIGIASQMMNPEKNGGKSAEDIMRHLTEDELVLWAWNPGINSEGLKREKPPVPKEAFIKAVKEWIAAGAPIPKE